MKTFMLVAMLIALLITAWLVGRDISERSSGKSGPAAIKAIDRAEQASKKVDEANQAQERRLEGAVKE